MKNALFALSRGLVKLIGHAAFLAALVLAIVSK